jgi:large repetitive protein
VQKVDVWGTTTTTVYGLDATSGVATTEITVTSASGAYTLTDTAVTNSDGTLASRTRVDSSGTATLTESYNTDGTPASLSMSFNGTPIVTQTFGYDATTGSPTTVTYSQNGSTIASDQVTYSPNSTRALSDVITVGSDTYTFDYTYNGAGWLDGASLASSNASVSGSWDYTFTADGSAQAGENPNAYLNGNITQKTSTVNGTSTTVDYHYDYNDKLTRTTDPAIGSNLVYDSFGRMTTVGSDTITYNSYGAPITVSDGSNTVAYTRLASLGIIEKATTTSSGTSTIRYSAGGLVLDTSNNPINQTTNFGPVTATFAISGGSTQFQLNTLSGHRLLTMSSSGTLTSSSPVLFDPYGGQIQPALGTTPDGSVPNYAWMAGAAQESEDVALPYVMMGARVYLPTLGLFSSPDPQPTGGLTPYNYAVSDPINNLDPDGLSWKSFTHWMRQIFWKDSLKWSFGSHEPAWHYAVTAIVLAIIVIAVCYFACAAVMASTASAAPTTLTTTAVLPTDIVDVTSVESGVSPLVENLDAGGDLSGSAADAAPKTGPYDEIIDPLQEKPTGIGQSDPNAGYFDDPTPDSDDSDDDDDDDDPFGARKLARDVEQNRFNMSGQLQGRFWQMTGKPIPANPYSALTTSGTTGANVNAFNAGFYQGYAAAMPK